jgi:hypothetical protein
MEDFDIETINFDEYNREIYLDNKLRKRKESRYLGNSQADDAQKRYKYEINKFVSEYKRTLGNSEFDETDLGRLKKRKI